MRDFPVKFKIGEEQEIHTPDGRNVKVKLTFDVDFLFASGYVNRASQDNRFNKRWHYHQIKIKAKLLLSNYDRTKHIFFMY